VTPRILKTQSTLLHEDECHSLADTLAGSVFDRIGMANVPLDSMTTPKKIGVITLATNHET
jgi:hypothetical protein